MDITSIKRETGRLLHGLEEGTLDTADAFAIADKIDPLLTHFVIKYLRKVYPPTEETSQGVLGRIVELTSAYPSVVQACREGEKDPMNEWFDDELNLRDYKKNSDDFVEVLVEKMEG